MAGLLVLAGSLISALSLQSETHSSAGRTGLVLLDGVPEIKRVYARMIATPMPLRVTFLDRYRSPAYTYRRAGSKLSRNEFLSAEHGISKRIRGGVYNLRFLTAKVDGHVVEVKLRRVLDVRLAGDSRGTRLRSTSAVVDVWIRTKAGLVLYCTLECQEENTWSP